MREETGPITVVPMERAHLEALARLEALCFSEPWSVKGLEAELANRDAAFFVARVGETAAGYLGMYCILDTCSLANLAVFPQFRRQGVAQALLDRAVREAEARGADTLTLEVRASNGAAIRLYEKNGFRKVGERPGFYRAPPEAALLLTRALGAGEAPGVSDLLCKTEESSHEIAGH